MNQPPSSRNNSLNTIQDPVKFSIELDTSFSLELYSLEDLVVNVTLPPATPLRKEAIHRSKFGFPGKIAENETEEEQYSNFDLATDTFNLNQRFQPLATPPRNSIHSHGNFPSLPTITVEIPEPDRKGLVNNNNNRGVGISELILEGHLQIADQRAKPKLEITREATPVPEDDEVIELDSSTYIDVSTLEEQGLEFLRRPRPVAPGIKLVATGASPSELDLKIPFNVNAADTTNTDQLQPGGGLGLNLTGAGITVGVWDGGKIRETHQELAGRVTFGDSASSYSNHATHVAGTIGASGVVASAEGMATQVSLVSYDFNSDKTEMATAASGGLILSNHSYGNIAGWTTGVDWGIGPVDTWFDARDIYSTEDPDFGIYNTSTQQLDQLLYDNPNYLSVWSAGNDRNDSFSNARGTNEYVTYLQNHPNGAGWYLVDTSVYSAPPSDGNGGTGYDSLSPDQNAKNSLVVGAIHDITVDPYTNTDVSMSSFSSWGPTDDGRIKPDVVGNGVSLHSSGSSSDTAYYFSSGTSMSSPNVTGTIALLDEHYNNLFSATPRSATMKGLVTHTAFDAGNTGPDYVHGWGVMDGAAAANFLTDVSNNDPSVLLEENTYTGSEWVLDLFSDGSSPLKATITWTDLPGTAKTGLDDTTPVLVNDLDLWITAPDNTIYNPWTLDPANPSNPAVRTTSNHIDNIEQVLIDTTQAGTYSLHVGHTGSSFTQDYSLLVEGFTTPLVSLSLSDSPFAENGGVATVTASLNGIATQDVTVDFGFSGTATNGTDYSASANSIIIPAGNTTGSITLTGIDDTIDEPDESVIVDITNVTNAFEDGTQQVTATITDDEPTVTPFVTLSIDNTSFVENEQSAKITATLSELTSQDVTIDLGFTGDATLDSDYNISNSQIVIPAGNTTGSIKLMGIDDTATEGNEAIFVNITNVTNGIKPNIQEVTTMLLDNETASVSSGTVGNDNISGTTGDDSIQGDSGNDIINGLDGNDRLHGQLGSDVINGGNGYDFLTGGDENDILLGEASNDRLYGEAGNDRLFGGAGNDFLVGGTGDDLLDGGLGSDRLVGQGGSDIFVLRSGDGNDLIYDFEVGIDYLGLAAGLSFNDLSFTNNSYGVEISTTSELLATLSRVSATDLSVANFVSV